MEHFDFRHDPRRVAGRLWAFQYQFTERGSCVALRVGSDCLFAMSLINAGILPFCPWRASCRDLIPESHSRNPGRSTSVPLDYGAAITTAADCPVPE